MSLKRVGGGQDSDSSRVPQAGGGGQDSDSSPVPQAGGGGQDNVVIQEMRLKAGGGGQDSWRCPLLAAAFVGSGDIEQEHLEDRTKMAPVTGVKISSSPRRLGTRTARGRDARRKRAATATTQDLCFNRAVVGKTRTRKSL